MAIMQLTEFLSKEPEAGGSIREELDSAKQVSSFMGQRVTQQQQQRVTEQQQGVFQRRPSLNSFTAAERPRGQAQTTPRPRGQAQTTPRPAPPLHVTQVPCDQYKTNLVPKFLKYKYTYMYKYTYVLKINSQIQILISQIQIYHIRRVCSSRSLALQVQFAVESSPTTRYFHQI